MTRDPHFALVQTPSSAPHVALRLSEGRCQPETVCGLAWSSQGDYDPSRVICLDCRNALAFTLGLKVSYNALSGGRVLGKVVRRPYRIALLGWHVDVKVTSLRHSYYSRGEVLPLSLTSPWLHVR